MSTFGRRFAVVGTIGVLFVAALSGSALAAGGAAADQYGGEAPVKVLSGSASASDTAPSKGSLPFTGASLFVTVGVGAALLGAGFMLRRRETD